ncbi:Antigenic thaumatin-like protein [Penicillium longicatenatum]|uniref:Antigenic thaumatin-like protein n=1 Tax=Penicillium longicatenatum TaxID=1561947 RepID=UPI0025495B21|nr:Antigenic thaumatin-like protein [Penicillium longicatenatum]KAJ5650721.1 Antigenic thaumatin-like protein [Penicillium longicatenatum]
MKLLNLFPILSLATLAASHPGTKTKKDHAGISSGVFSSSNVPSPVQSFVPFGASSTATPTSSVGQAVVKNNCEFPIYIWSVGSTVRPVVTTDPNGQYAETFRYDSKSGGIAIKITTVPDGLWQSAPLTIFSYNLSGDGEVWYDLSDIFGDPFKGYPVVLQPAESAEPAISWENGQSPAGSSVLVHSAVSDLVLTLC